MGAIASPDAVIRRRLIAGTLLNYGGRFAALGVWFLLTPFLLRYLGSEGYGLWALASSVVAYGSLLELGIGGAVTKYVAEHMARGEPDRARRIVATSIWLYLGLGVLALAAAGLLAALFPLVFTVSEEQRATARWLVLLMGLSVAVSIPGAVTSAVLRGLQRYDLVNGIGVAGTLLSAGATVAALLLGGGLLGMVAVQAPVSLLMLGVGAQVIERASPGLFGLRGGRRSEVATIFRFSAVLLVTDISSRLQHRSDEIVIGASLPIGFVTPYTLARRLAELPRMLSDQFVKLLLPLASELHAGGDRARLRTLLVESTRVTLAMAIPTAAALSMLAGPALAAWVGPQYADAAPLVVILSAAGVASLSAWPASAILQGMARHRWLAGTTTAAAIANVVLSLALIGPLGLAGVAIGTLVPAAVECLFVLLPYAMRQVGVGVGEAVRRIAVPVLVPLLPMIAALHGLGLVLDLSSRPQLALVAGAGLVVYAGAYLLVGASETERQTYQGLAVKTLRLAGARRRP